MLGGSTGQISEGVALEAIQEAVSSLAQQLAAGLPNISVSQPKNSPSAALVPASNAGPAKLDQLTGEAKEELMTRYPVMVSTVNGNRLILTGGVRAGLKIGDQLEVREITAPALHPVTGKIVDFDTKLIEVVTVVAVSDQSALAQSSSVQSPAKLGNVLVSLNAPPKDQPQTPVVATPLTVTSVSNRK